MSTIPVNVFALSIAVIMIVFLFVLQQIRTSYIKRRLDEAIINAEKRNIQLSYFAETAAKLSSALSKTKLLRLIIETFGEITKSEKNPSICALYLMDYNINRFVYETGYNMDITMLSRPSFNIDEQPFKALRKNREIIFYGEGDNIKGIFFKEKKLPALEEIDFGILIPMVVENEVMGVVVSFLAEPSIQFLKKDSYLLQVLAGQASIALGSAVQSELAVLDRLTKIYNQAYFKGRLEQEVARSDRYKYPVSVLMLDIDHFKWINDTYGHLQGDIILKEVARIIKTNIRIVDLCARYGGEEFAVILPETDLTGISKRGEEAIKEPKDLEEVKGAVAKAERLRKMIEESEIVTAENFRIKVTISIGIAVKGFPEGTNMTKDDLIREADRQLYRAKQEGRNRVCY